MNIYVETISNSGNKKLKRIITGFGDGAGVVSSDESSTVGGAGGLRTAVGAGAGA